MLLRGNMSVDTFHNCGFPDSIADPERVCRLRINEVFSLCGSPKAQIVAQLRPSTDASTGVSSIDSPQPQADVWLGLSKVKPERSLVTS